jgi:hypothetical protein
MDFLIEPIITIETDLLPADRDAVAKPCCSSGSGCSSGMATNVDTKEV